PVVVGAGPFRKLQVLAPGESAAPGTANGKNGAPAAQSPDTPFNVTVNAVDDYWNISSSITDQVGIVSSDLQATLPVNSALVAGTKLFSVVLSTTGTNMITATDLDDAAKTPGTSSGIVVVARYTTATGGSAISADTTGGAFTGLSGPTYSE